MSEQSSADALRKGEEAVGAFSSSPRGTTQEPCFGAKKYVLEVLVAGQDESLIADVAVALFKREGGMTQSRTSSAGTVRFTGLDQGAYGLALPELDQDTWEVIANEALGSDAEQDPGRATWVPGPKDGGDSPIEHEVEQGDCVSSLAALYGFTAEALWDLPENGSLKSSRKEKNVLCSGNPHDSAESRADIVRVPGKRLKVVEASTGNRYTVRHKGMPEYLRVSFIDAAGRPRAGEPYLLRLEGVDDGVIAIEGETDSSGLLEEPISPRAVFGSITLGKGEERRTFEIAIGHLEPINTITGLQGRLANLGYSCGDEDGELGATTRNALQRFQAANSLPVTGEADEATVSKLEELHLI